MNTKQRRSSLHTGLLRSVAMVGAGALTIFGTAAVAPIAYAEQPDAQPTNWALADNGSTIAVSGTEVNDGRWSGDKLIDGEINPEADKPAQSRWSSNTSDNAWATVTFAEPHALDHINLWMEVACPKQWDLLVSEDGTSFTEKIGHSDAQQCASTAEKATKVVVDIPQDKKATAYKAVKLQVRERTPIGGTKYGASLWEIQAFDGPEVTPPPAPPAPPAEQSDAPGSSLVPKPVNLTVAEGQPGFTLTPEVKIVAAADLKNEADLLAASLRSSTGYDVPVVTESADTTNVIRLATGAVDGSDKDEAYSLVSNENGVTITGVGAHGVFNGSMTLLQLLPGFAHMHTPVIKDWVVPAVTISDWPRFAYRGMMLDIARSFIPKEDIEKLIDTMSQYKISALHLHLSDDQGWRIEITNEGKAEGDPIDYTQLTEVSGKTAMLPHGSQASKEMGRTGFLTQADYRELQQYAAQRHVMVIPEIDLPGHSNAALHAIPELNIPGSSHEGTPEQPTAPANGTGAVGYSYLDPQAEITTTFITHVLGQLADMTDGPYIHIGGDEPHALTARYGGSVYNNFLGGVLDIVRGFGKTPIGWNEIAHATGLQPGDTLHYWAGQATATRYAVQYRGAKTLLSKGATSYLDQRYNSKTPLALTWACHGNNCDFKTYYNWDPRVFIGLDNDNGITGTETPLWSETVRGIDQVEFLTFNRVLSHAEIGWTPQNERDVDDFAARISQIGVDLNATGSNFYDGVDGEWGYDVAGVHSTSSATDGTFQLGYLSAPGTKVAADGLRIETDTVDDVDGVSRSLVGGAGLQVMVDWGDGSAAEPATITPTLERSEYNASGMYTLTANHNFAAAGKHEVTLTAGNRSAKAIIVVDANGTATAPLFSPWVASGDATIALGQETAKPLDRVKLDVTQFTPNTLVEIFFGDKKIGEVRPEADGTQSVYMLIPGGTKTGVYSVRAVEGERTAETSIAIWAPASTGGALKSEVPGLTLLDYDSEETVGEDAPAAYAIDGLTTTFWHTKWKDGADQFPHHISLNLNKQCTVSGLEYTPRQDSDNTRIKDYEIYVSADGQDWGEAVATGRFDASATPKYVAFDKVQANYVKFVGLNAQNGRDFGGAAEIRIDGDCGESSKFAVTAGEGDNAVTLSKADADKVTVEAEAGSTVTLHIAGAFVDGQATLWAGDDHMLVAHTDVTAGEDATLTFTADKAMDKKVFEVVTPKNRRYFILNVTEAAQNETPGDDQTGDDQTGDDQTGDDQTGDDQTGVTDEVATEAPYADSDALDKALAAGEVKIAEEYTVHRGDSQKVNFSGLTPDTQARVYMYSTPTALPGFVADAHGAAAGYTVGVDAKTELGTHYVVAVSNVPGTQPVSIVKLNVVDKAGAATAEDRSVLGNTGVSVLILLVLAAGMLGSGAFMLRLRRD